MKKSLMIGLIFTGIFFMLLIFGLFKISNIGIHKTAFEGDTSYERIRFNLEEGVLQQKTTTFFGRVTSGFIGYSVGKTEKFIILKEEIETIPANCSFEYRAGEWYGGSDHKIFLSCKQKNSRYIKQYQVIEDYGEDIEKYRKYHQTSSDIFNTDEDWIIMSDAISKGYTMPTKENPIVQISHIS